jgi:hypothetical protein
MQQINDNQCLSDEQAREIIALYNLQCSFSAEHIGKEHGLDQNIEAYTSDNPEENISIQKITNNTNNKFIWIMQ